jgi:hypothetical protein
MQTIILLANKQVAGEIHMAGDVVTVEDDSALYLIRAGSARLATDDESNRRPNPRPASEVRRLQEAQAIEGGPRPQRRG